MKNTLTLLKILHKQLPIIMKFFLGHSISNCKIVLYNTSLFVSLNGKSENR